MFRPGPAYLERVNLRFTTQREIFLRKGNLRLNGLLMARSGHSTCTDECPLLGVKRT
jgi:hypothetical protein